jgi:hypothetical protein
LNTGTGSSLDQRYQEFTGKTGAVFAEIPQIEPLRHLIFRDLLIDPKPFEWRDSAKQWLRPLVRRHHTPGPFRPSDILLWIETAREVISEALLPVFHDLIRRGQRVTLVSLNGPPALHDDSIRFEYPTAFRIPRWAKRAWTGLCDTEPHLAKPGLADWFFSASMDLEGCLNELDRVLDVTRPQAVVTASTQLLGGAALMVSGNLKGLSTILLQHGLVQPFYTPLVAKVMCTWGQSSNTTLTRLGIDAHRLYPFGSPRHDALRPADRAEARRMLVHELALEDKPIMVFFSNGNDVGRNGCAPEECAQWLEAVAEKYHRQVNFVVRLHPNENGALYRRCSHLTITKNRPGLGLVLSGCDCIGSLCSTAMLDALLYRKPVWQFHADGWPELADNWKLGLATRIGSRLELAGAIERLLDADGHSPRPNGMVERVFNNHGHATQAVAEFIVSEATERRPTGHRATIPALAM